MKGEWDPQCFFRSELFLPIREAGLALSKEKWPDAAELSSYCTTICNSRGMPLRFVEPCEDGLGYEPRIYLRGEVQTRSRSWHDLFNALVWMRFPKAKSCLNRLHFQEIEKTPEKRSRMRDVATLFDESGILVVSSSEFLLKLLRNFEWKTLFWENRNRVVEEMRFYIFGHGLYEKALLPYVGLTGHGIPFEVEHSFFSLPLEAQIARLDNQFEDRHARLATPRDLCPVPLLGYPGWSEDNADPAYYENTRYFRRGRFRGD